MNVSPENSSAVTIRPPQLIQSLVSGFNAVASNVYLILLPVTLDVLLWFGPHLRMKTLMEPDVKDVFNLLRLNSAQQLRPLWDSAEAALNQTLARFNVVSQVSTFPVGIPALMVKQMPVQTPLGAPQVFEVHSYAVYFLIWMGLVLLGLLLGSVYLATIAQVCGKMFDTRANLRSLEPRPVTGATATGDSTRDESAVGETGPANSQDIPAGLAGFVSIQRVPPLRARTLAWQFLQVVVMVILIAGILLILTAPALVIASLLALVSPLIFWIATLLIGFSVVWFMIPFVFSPHGIFLCGQSVFNAMLNSTRVVRFNMPGTGMFLLVALVLYQGLGLLWRTPPDTSWMALIGILGHAFVITGLLAASFVYYRSGLAYVQALRQLMTKKT